jgi:four helix bundle protein
MISSVPERSDSGLFFNHGFHHEPAVAHPKDLQSAGRREHSVKTMTKFRFQDLEIWSLAIEIADELFDIADELEKKHLYRFAEQLRASGMSMSNNIAEGSGSSSKKEFNQFLNIAKRSTFENANILILLEKRSLITKAILDRISDKLDHLCRKITNFQKTLK